MNTPGTLAGPWRNNGLRPERVQICGRLVEIGGPPSAEAYRIVGGNRRTGTRRAAVADGVSD
jgi:hypothetical protein